MGPMLFRFEREQLRRRLAHDRVGVRQMCGPPRLWPPSRPTTRRMDRERTIFQIVPVRPHSAPTDCVSNAPPVRIRADVREPV